MSHWGWMIVAVSAWLPGMALQGCTRPNPLYNPRDAAGGEPDGAVTVDAGVDRDWKVDGRLPASCLELQEHQAPTGVYTVDPGTGSGPFQVACNMSTLGGGWTRVGYEAAGSEGTFAFLSSDVGEPSDIAARSGNGLIGRRFAGQYQDVLVRWRYPSESSWQLQIRATPAAEMFANEVNFAIPVTSFSTTDTTLDGWVKAGGGAILCRASASPNVRPGGSSWAFKPVLEPSGECGCNGLGWAGRGAFYGGSRQPTTCANLGGGWAGVIDSGAVKAGITDFETEIWIR